MPAVKLVVDAEHVHRSALAVRNARGAPGQLGHDQLGIDAIGQHVTMVAISGDDAVFRGIERRLQPDGHRFLPDVEVAEAADQTQTIQLAGFFLEPADQHHLLVEVQQLGLAGRVAAAGSVGFLQRAQRRRCIFSRSILRFLAGSGQGQFPYVNRTDGSL